MTGGFGEVLVMDWGVAKVAGAHEPSAVLGTPGFMAPEQAGDASRAEERSDVFGLGALLGALLDARPEPVPPRLAAIRRKAMAAVPGARYASAEAFAADLRGYLDGSPVAAYREGPLERIGRIAHRHRTAILLVAAYVVMRVVILVWRGI
jgi:serine/threonine protein kinase